MQDLEKNCKTDNSEIETKTNKQEERMTNFFSKTVFFLVMTFFITFSSAWATYQADITYDYTGAAGAYTFNFTVHNTSTGADIGGLDYFMINFDADDLSLYSNIAWVDDKGWDSEADQPDLSFYPPGLPGYVFADDSILVPGTGGIAQGGSLGGFKVSFNYTGNFAADDLEFTWLAYFGTDQAGGVLGEARGLTNYVPGTGPGPDPIPEPATMVLFGLGLLSVAGISRKK